jgi:adenosylmethionine-8-amino-7-oxononanoate aminotransferase
MATRETTETTGQQHNQELADKDRRYVWHAMARHTQEGPPSPMMVESGDGAWVTDAEGNRYLDGMSGLWCVNVGYGREELAKAAYDQLVKLPYYPLTGSHKPAVELGEALNWWLDPSGSSEYVIFYSNSGSEANETAFKIARQYHEQNGDPERWKFVSRYRAYHGNGFASLAATGQAQRKYRYEPLSPGFLHVDPPDTYRCEYCGGKEQGKECGKECAVRYARQIERVILYELPETVAAVIMEPIITGGGIITPQEDYMSEVQRICKENGVLLICDEVICGFGRTGENFGFHNYLDASDSNASPDIVTMAKGITSAYLPLSATAVKREIYDTFAGTGLYDNLRHVNTFGGNPAACAVAVKNLQVMEEEELPRRSKEMGERLYKELEDLWEHPNVGDIRHKGLLFGIEMVEDKESKRPAQDKAAALIAGCKQRGLIVGKNGDTVAGYNNVVVLSPPLSITEDDLEFIAGTLKEAAESL